MTVTRADLQKLSEAKITDASLLFSCGRWGNAYYLAGYAVELALKACAARQIVAEAIPDRKFITELYTHVFDKLIGLSGLRAELQQKLRADPAFAASWGITSEWHPDYRYEAADKSTAHYLLNALQDEKHGVLPWIKTYW